MLSKFIATILGAVILFGCSDKEIVPERFYPRNDHEAYWYSLKQANLLNTALGKEWVNAAERPFQEQIKVQLPYQEAFEISDLQPDAHGYRFDVKRGQKVLVDINMITNDTTRVFVDLFRVDSDSPGKYRHIASADSVFNLAFAPRRDASYILRLQPELLRGGQFEITIENIPTLDFPVAGKNKTAILSFFGDPRDGGRRDHHGVDIFAKKHTPILAPINADVRFVGTRGIGGKVVWLYDRKTGNRLYFAHLQEYTVERYQKVNRGDTIGTVGNTGNARFTPPHLHFGIYNNGPIDPYSFIVPEYKRPSKFKADTTLLGREILLNKTITLKKEMQRSSQNSDTLWVGEQLKIAAVNHSYVRVIYQDGKKGFIAKDDIQKL